MISSGAITEPNKYFCYQYAIFLRKEEPLLEPVAGPQHAMEKPVPIAGKMRACEMATVDFPDICFSDSVCCSDDVHYLFSTGNA